MSKRAIRRLGCDGIDYLGRTQRSPKTDKKLAAHVINNISDKSSIPKLWDRTVDGYCKHRHWLSSKYDNMECKPHKLPLLEMLQKKDHYAKQYVLGRMANLKDYYACPDLFYTLDSDDWDTLYQINDLFIYCAQHSIDNDFPIRIVTDNKRGIHNTDPKHGLYSYKSKLVTLPHLLQQHKNIHILAREVCQLVGYFKLRLYQSLEFPHIFFATKKSPSRLARKIEKLNLKEVTIT
jgi:hypothetical protein